MIRFNARDETKHPILRLIGKEWVREGKRYPDSAHPFWEIVYVVEGKGTFLVENQRHYPLAEGKLILIKPEVVHASFPSKQGYLAYCLFLDWPGWNILPEGSRSIEVKVQETILIELLLDRILECFVSGSQTQMVANLSNALVYLLKTELLRRTTAPAFSSSARHCKAALISKKIIRMIEARYGQPLKVADMARQAGLSQSRMFFIFKKAVGCPPNAYLIQYRLNMAKHFLLSDPSVPIKKIASETGFRNLNHFYLQFKKSVGATPAQYRQTPG
ncbi:MAG: helix-turn-helix domain-containing protein [Verrucomicrobia bacterium]|nr:helix-turn-helix domain-containing protein [Verrucomicrobiota bacterium]